MSQRAARWLVGIALAGAMLVSHLIFASAPAALADETPTPTPVIHIGTNGGPGSGGGGGGM